MSNYNAFTSNQSSSPLIASGKPLQNTSPAFMPTTQAAWKPTPNQFSFQELPKSQEEIPYDARVLFDGEDDIITSSSSDSEGIDLMPAVPQKFKTFAIKEWDFGQEEANRRKSEILQTSSPLLPKPSSSSGEGSLRNQALSVAGKVTVKPTYFQSLNTLTHAKADTKTAYFMVIEGFTITHGKRFFKIEKLCHNLKTTEGNESRDFLYISLSNDNETGQRDPQNDWENIFEPWVYAVPHMHFRLVLTVYMTHAYQDPFTFDYVVDLRQFMRSMKEKRTQNMEIVYSEPGKTMGSTGNDITLNVQLTCDKSTIAQGVSHKNGNQRLFSEYAVIFKQIFVKLPLSRTESPMPVLSPLMTNGLHSMSRPNDVYAKRGSAINLGQEKKSSFVEFTPSSPMSWSNFSPETSSPLQKLAQRPQRIPSDPQKPPGLEKKVPTEVPNSNQFMQGGSLFNFKKQQRFSVQPIKTVSDEIMAQRVNRIQSSDLSVVLEGNKSPLKILEAYVKAVKGDARRPSNNTSERSSIFNRIQHASTGLTENDMQSLNTLNASSYGDSMAEIGQVDGEESSQKSTESVEDFKVEEHVGSIAEFTKTYQGSRVMQKYIITAPKEDLNLIVQEIGDKINELMLDQYSSHIIQLLFQHGSPQHRLYLLQKLAPCFVSIARDKQGTHSLQAILAQLNTPDEFSILKVIVGGSSFELSLDPRANYVIQKLINIIPVDSAYFLYQPLFDNFVQVANNSFGLLVLKQMMTRIEQKEPLRQKVVDLACHSFEKLIQNPYGNYALQHILEFYTDESHGIMNKIINKIIPYSSQKISSNVIEKFLAVCDSQFRARVVDEILNNSRLGDLMKNKYGNFVALQLLATASNLDKQRLMQEVYRCANVFSGTKYKARWIKFIEENPLKINWNANTTVTQEESDLAKKQEAEEEEKRDESQEVKHRESNVEKLEEVKKIWREMTKEEKTDIPTPNYVKPKGKKNYKKRKDNVKGWPTQQE